MNPCPCGFHGDSVRECRCPPQQIARYADRISGPLRDRLDLVADVPAVSVELLSLATSEEEQSGTIRERVARARVHQGERFTGQPMRTNAEMSHAAIRRHCRLGSACRRLLADATRRLALSARGYDRVLKVARTIADLAGDPMISTDHLAEAIQFRCGV